MPIVLPSSVRRGTRSGSTRSRGLTDEVRTGVDFCTYVIGKPIKRKGAQGASVDQSDEKRKQGRRLSRTAPQEDDDSKTSSSESDEADGVAEPDGFDVWDAGMLSSKKLDRLLGSGAGDVRAASFQHVNRITPEGLFRPWESMLEVMTESGARQIYRKGHHCLILT